MIEEFERLADLFDNSVVQDDDLVGHRHRLDLVVRDIDDGRLEPLVEFLDLGTHLHAELCIEIGQRLVEQEGLWIAHNRPTHRNALPLAARKLLRKAVQEFLEP